MEIKVIYIMASERLITRALRLRLRRAAAAPAVSLLSSLLDTRSVGIIWKGAELHVSVHQLFVFTITVIPL